MHRILVILTATGVAALLAACGDDGLPREADRRPKPVRVVGTEYAYAMPARIRGGVVEMQFINDGDEIHEYAMGYIDPPHTLKELVDLFLDPEPEEQQEEPTWSHDVGGVPALSPGERVTITRRLKPGNYGVLCFVPAPDGKPHIEHGMYRQFTVTGTSDTALPRPDAVVEAQEKRFAVPALRPGQTTIELRNAASSEREFGLLRLEPGKSMEDVEASFRPDFRGPPPAALLGAIQSIPSGTSVFLGIHLVAGATYVVYDEESGIRSRLTVAR